MSTKLCHNETKFINKAHSLHHTKQLRILLETIFGLCFSMKKIQQFNRPFLVQKMFTVTFGDPGFLIRKIKKELLSKTLLVLKFFRSDQHKKYI